MTSQITVPDLTPKQVVPEWSISCHFLTAFLLIKIDLAEVRSKAKTCTTSFGLRTNIRSEKFIQMDIGTLLDYYLRKYLNASIKSYVCSHLRPEELLLYKE